MPYFHVIGKLNHSGNTRVLLADLSQDMLQRDFIKPYERGSTFFSGNDLVDPKELTQVRIIETLRTESLEREEMNRADRENIDSINSESSGVFFLSIGGGYAPEDIADAGVDVSQKFIKGAPGYKYSTTRQIAPMLGWAAGIVSAVIASGIAKWLGWI
jgi:hypothetical protein